MCFGVVFIWGGAVNAGGIVVGMCLICVCLGDLVGLCVLGVEWFVTGLCFVLGGWVWGLDR